ncbi:MAG: Ig-like domain-containing protein [Akkermansiaceae bacterium]|nr:Ig-like domain-containing protein [Akkermansiaceae bacterium]
MKTHTFSLITTCLIALATFAPAQTTPTLLFKDDFHAANGTSLTDPATRATGTLASTVKYGWTGTANLTTQDVVVDGTLNWDSNGDRNGLHQQPTDTSNQNFRMTYNWAPLVNGRVWEVEFDQRVAVSHPLTFGLSDNVQNGAWDAWNNANYDFAAGSYGTSLNYDTDNDGGSTIPTQVVNVFPGLVATNPPSNQIHHFRIRFDEPNRTATVWINGVQKAQVTSLDFENAGRYLSWGEPTTYAGALDDITVSVFETPPTIVSYNPARAATAVNPAAPLVATFSNAITLTGAGSITIQDMAGTNHVAINVTDPAQVSVSGTDLIITPPARLAYGTPFKVVIGPGTVTNFSTEPTNDQWTFTTAVQGIFPTVVFKDDFNAANGTSLTDPAARAKGMLASTVKYGWTGTANLTTQDVVVDGTLNWDSNGNRNGQQQQPTDTSVQNFRMTYNWAPQVAGRVWEVEFDQRVAWSHPLTFGLSDNVQNGAWAAWNDANYDFAVGSVGTSLYYDTDNDGGSTIPTLITAVFPVLVATNPPSNQIHHFRIRFDEPNGTATTWINGVQKVQVASLDFENAGRYLSWGEPSLYAGALDNITVSVFETPLAVVSYIPAEAATGAYPSIRLMATFSNAITLTGAGSINIQDMVGANGVTINVRDPAQVSVSGTDLIITPPARLAYGTRFKVVVGSGTVVNYSAETIAAQWTFTTAAQELPSQAADEAERLVWKFNTQNLTWWGNGPLQYSAWPVRDMTLRVTNSGNVDPFIQQGELLLPADIANVLQIRMYSGSARKCQLWFTTGISPTPDRQKMVEFDLTPGSSMQDYTLDLKNMATWQDQISSLKFVFLGAKFGEELGVERIKVFDGEKISKPMIYTNYQPGGPPVIKEFRMGSLFNNAMVLQRNKPVPVWGHGKPQEVVTVEFAGQRKSAVADASGKWVVVLDPLQASAESRRMTMTSNLPEHRIELNDILVGDVWLCGGQSNMGGNTVDNPPPADRRKELIETDYPLLRTAAMPTLHRGTPLPNDASDTLLSWNAIAGTNRGNSAVGYYFGQAIQVSQNIPVGLVYIIKAGTQVEQWTSQEVLKSIFTDGELRAICSDTSLASGLYNGMVAPIHPFPIAGAFWYQGESNADNQAKYMGYYKSLPSMIGMWRSMWGQNLPVLLVQLPAYAGQYPTESWAHIREVQQLCSTVLPSVGTAVTFDEGNPRNLHPANKYFIGTRLGLIARSKVYGEILDYSGPTFKSSARQGNTLLLTFDHVGSGLKNRGELTGFEVFSDGQWLAAQALIIDKDRISVSNPTVPAPTAVRYAWANSPTATLFNELNLPAGPFRSDTPVALIEAVQTSYSSGSSLGIGPEIFANWISHADFGIAPGDQGLNSDPDGDGISNGVENYFGTDPGKFSKGLVPVTANAGTGTFTFTHPLNPTGAGNLTAAYRWSRDLSTFTAGGVGNNGSTVTFTQSAPSGGFVTVTATVTGAPLDKLFVDLRMTQN